MLGHFVNLNSPTPRQPLSQFVIYWEGSSTHSPFFLKRTLAPEGTPEESLTLPRICTKSSGEPKSECQNQVKEFQSAPHFSSEANRSQGPSKVHINWFQSAPHFSSEANPVAVSI